MNDRTYVFTAESVSEGHPDKIADQISDRIVDAFLAREPDARIACDTLLANQLVVVAGEFRTIDATVFRDVEAAAEGLVRRTLREIGYSDAATGIDPRRCKVQIAFNHQFLELGRCDHEDRQLAAGDRGLVFGYACDETPELMPLPIMLAHQLVRRQAELRRSGALPWLRPDATSQVTVRYADGAPVAVETVVLSTQHDAAVSLPRVRAEVRAQIVDAVIPPVLRSDPYEVLVNPAGRFTVGGPKAATALTGRKIVVDTYGGSCPHGGGAFSGKDPSKVDRSAAYMARNIAKHIVAAGFARRVTLQLAYAIASLGPMSVYVDTHGTGTVPNERLEDAVPQVFPLVPWGMQTALKLQTTRFRKTSAYGHFGRREFAWERTPRLKDLQNHLSPKRGPSRDQRNLSRFVQEINSPSGASTEAMTWWLNRY